MGLEAARLLAIAFSVKRISKSSLLVLLVSLTTR